MSIKVNIKMKYLIVVFVAAFFGTVCSTPLFLKKEKIECKPEDKGIICDCNTPGVVYICMENEGKWEALPIDECPENKPHCVDFVAGGCSERHNPKCDLVPFICTSDWIFPDPDDCKGYHMCVPEADTFVDNSRKCNGNFGYDPVSTYCKTPLTNGKCTNFALEKPCEKPGGPHAYPGHPSMFYFCLKSHVEVTEYVYELYVCDNGAKFDETKSACEESSGGSGGES